ncbi:unnamed protein product, partial [marine sediment metagenome]
GNYRGVCGDGTYIYVVSDWIDPEGGIYAYLFLSPQAGYAGLYPGDMAKMMGVI